VNRRGISALSLAIGLAFSAGAMAENMSKAQYKSARSDIALEYKSEKAACGAYAGNVKDVCKVEAAGREKVAKAELEAGYKPSVDASYKLRVARAEAAYSVAKEKCDDASGNIKDVCIQEAKAAAVAAKADAKVQMKTADANAAAVATSNKASNLAGEKGAAARKDAAADKRDADYAVAKEKCDAFAGDAKSSCMSDARARYGKT
jgi:hypothetical protein